MFDTPSETQTCESCHSSNLRDVYFGDIPAGYNCQSCGLWGARAEDLAAARAAGASVTVEIREPEREALAALEAWFCPHGSPEHDCSMLCVCHHECRYHVDALGPCTDPKCICAGFTLSLAAEEAE